MDPLENNHKQRRFLIIAIVLVTAILVGLFFFRRDRDKGSVPYRTEAAGRGDITATVSATGTLSAVTTVQVGSQVSGIISRLYADFNSQVTKGQILAELDPTPFLQTVEQRQADVTRSQVEVSNNLVSYNRQKKLAAAGLISASDLDAAKAAYDSARAQLSLSQASLKQAKTNLGYAKIYSPIDGQVVDRQYDIGQTVAASFSAPTLFTIARDLTKMQVQADVDQSDIGRIKVGEPVHFTVDAYPEEPFHGAISQVRLNATVNQNVITYPVIIEVPNPDLRLRPSMTADVTIEVAKVSDVLQVPNAALRFRPATDEGEAGSGQRQGARSGGGRAGAGDASGGGQDRGGSGARRSFGGADGGTEGGGGRPARQPGQTVYVLQADGDGGKGGMRQVRIRTGLTDGRHTEVVQVLSGELKPGDQVITGLPTLKTEQQGNPGSSNPLGGRRGMGGPGRF